jgi:ABC-type iron transport system FetAB permease component
VSTIAKTGHLKKRDRNDFPDFDAKAQVPFVRLVLGECGKGRKLIPKQRETEIGATLEIVELICQEIRKVGFGRLR